MVFKKGNIPYSHFKGKHLPEEMKKKISLALKGHKGYWQGKKMSEISKKKRSISLRIAHQNKKWGFKKGEPSLKGMLGKTLSKETRQKMSLAHKGKKPYDMTEKTRERISIAKLGKRCSPNTEFKKGQFAKEKHRCWKGGITPEHRLLRTGVEWKNWRKQVFERDNFTCRICNKIGCYIEPHHIMSFAKFPEMRFERANGITLCKVCHNQTKTGRNG